MTVRACRLPPGIAVIPRSVRQSVRSRRRGHRCGALAYCTAYDVHRALVIGQIAPKSGIEPFTNWPPGG